MDSIRLFCIAALLVVCGCTLDAEDRCLSGYTWDPSVDGCRMNDTGEDSDTGTDSDTAQPADAGDDASGQDEPAQDGPSGYGDPCTNGGGECAGLDADYCLADDTQGMCTVQNCTPGGCPSGATCCDCGTIGKPVICIYDDVVADIIGKVCSCG